MAEDLRISGTDLRKLREANSSLEEIRSRLNIEDIGSALGEVEAAVSLILERAETFERFLGLAEGSPEQQAFRSTFERAQGALSGAERGFTSGAALGQLIPIPGAAGVLGLAGGAAGGFAGDRLAAQQEERRRESARRALGVTNDKVDFNNSVQQKVRDLGVTNAERVEELRSMWQLQKRLGVPR